MPAKVKTLKDTGISSTDNEAIVKYLQFKGIDPLPKVVPALLNSADITNYVALTGMLCPFNINNLKPASYGIPLLGKCVFWDAEGIRKSAVIGHEDIFTLPKNSITFVTLEPTIRLPDYIAARFNLTIDQIYRGLLLGTGPLVDPGFSGKLSIPLHNLTANDYSLRGGDRLIWIEFTKISPIDSWKNTDNSMNYNLLGKYVPFPEKKNKRDDVDDYLYEADPHRPIRSSIPLEIHKAAENVRIASQRAYEAEKTIRKLSIGFVIGTVIAATATIISLFASIYQVNSLVQDAVNYVSNANELSSTKFSNFRATENNTNAEINALQTQVANLKNTLNTPIPTNSQNILLSEIVTETPYPTTTQR